MDSLGLAAAGGTLGILLSFQGVRLFIAAAPANLPRLNKADVSLPILMAAAGLSILTALLFGLFPALRAMRVDPQSAMQSNAGRLANARDGQRIRHLLVGGQIAFTVALLIVTGLLLRSFSRLLNQQRDFDADHIALAEVHLFNSQYGDTQPQAAAARTAFIDRALAGIARLPGVKSVAVTSQMPLTGEIWVNGIERPEHPLPPEQEPNANMRWVSPEFASTLNIPLLSGRDLAAADRNHPKNVLISQQTALAAWPGEDPIGKTFQSGPTRDYTVVGIVANARVNDLKQTANMVYVPYWESAVESFLSCAWRSTGFCDGRFDPPNHLEHRPSGPDPNREVTERAGQRLGGHRTISDLGSGKLRLDGAAAGTCWRLRGHGIHRFASAAGIRYPHSARERARRTYPARPAGGYCPGVRRGIRWTGARFGSGTVGRKPAL